MFQKTAPSLIFPLPATRVFIQNAVSWGPYILHPCFMPLYEKSWISISNLYHCTSTKAIVLQDTSLHYLTTPSANAIWLTAVYIDKGIACSAYSAAMNIESA
jgi:hypothetical protein